MELESQIINNNNINIFSNDMFYDILSPSSYSITKSNGKDKLKILNANELNMGGIEISNHNVAIMSFPVSVMPPPPHKIVNYTNNNNNNNNKNNNSTIKRYQPRDSPRKRNYYRPISPKGYDSDESCSSYASRGTPTETRGKNTARGGYNTNSLDKQTVVFGKYSHSSPNVSNNYNQIQSNAQHNKNHNKNRYYVNSNNTTNNNSSNSSNNGKQKHVHYKNSMDNMVKRAHGLVERFKSRSEIMKIEPQPPVSNLEGPLNVLNHDIWHIYINRAQKETTYESKINLWKNIFLYIRRCLNSYGLFMVGSTMSGFGLESSDIDMCLLTKPFTNDPRSDSLHHLNVIRHLLIKNDVTEDPELILAKVPILKFKDKETGFEIDLNCNNSVGIRNTHLLYSYSRLDWRVRPLVIIVKIWAQMNNINDAKNMTVSSYSWALMVIHYLQCGVVPPVLPCLHGLMPEKFNSFGENHTMDVQEELQIVNEFKSDNELTLAELLIGFFQYYASYDFNHYAISVRVGSSLPIDECRYTKAPKNDPHQWKYLCIEEPFDYTNTARSVFDLESFRQIKNIINISYEQLSSSKQLSSILPLNEKQEIR